MAPGFELTIPIDTDDLVAKFLSVSEGAQGLLLVGMKLGSQQPGKGELLRLLNVLRTDPRTREIVAKLESVPYTQPKKSKAEHRQNRFQFLRKRTPQT
ncbi:hypothetical protein [Deinococcus aquatilis]|uniref:hypothetical protein n=1 Tax=Deinococcus aquatilis TaxID=519440 RepID=UPI00035C0ED1|nr:hypothetical protein [Deinococcus aquatilis]